jgi:hypothetical protein
MKKMCPTVLADPTGYDANIVVLCKAANRMKRPRL